MENQKNFTEQEQTNFTSAGTNIILACKFEHIPENQFITMDGEPHDSISYNSIGRVFSSEFEIF